MAQTMMSRWGDQAILIATRIVAPIATPIVIPEQILPEYSTLASAMIACTVRLANRKHATVCSMQFTSIKLVAKDTN
ncbi:MAG: hypothetical protein ACJA2G_000071 [Cognaticolwellia sp.]|jgi:hypothetical protein